MSMHAHFMDNYDKIFYEKEAKGGGNNGGSADYLSR